MINMNNSLVDLLHCQWQLQNNMAHVLQAIQLSWEEHADGSLVDGMPTFEGGPESCFN